MGSDIPPQPEALDLAARFPHLTAICRELAEGAVFATRLDVATIADGRLYWGTFGKHAARATSNDLFELHCLTKPIVAWTLLEVANRHGVDPLEPIGTILGPSRFDDAVTIAGICNHTSRLALPSGLDWIATDPSRCPALADLRQEEGGSWYSEVGAWVAADATISTLERRPAAEVVAEVIGRCDADAMIGTPVPDDRNVVVPVAGLPDAAVPMLHVEHPTFQARLGVPFGGFGSVVGYVRFLRQIARAIRDESTALEVGRTLIESIAKPRAVSHDDTWRRPAGFRYGMVDGTTPGEAGDGTCLTMFAGVASGAGLVDLHRDRQVAFASNGASFDADDHRFVRRPVLGAFLRDTDVAATT